MTQQWTLETMPDQTGRVAIVTGSNSGIGLETAAALAARGATVVMACRSLDKAERAAQSIRTRNPAGDVVVMRLDIADLDSIKTFVAEFNSRFDRLDLLCNNAGVMGASAILRTKHGFESQFGTNHLGHFALTGQLLDVLQATAGARVVSVSSVAHKATPGLNLDDPNFNQSPYKPFDAYGKSKLANLLFTLELDRRLKAAGLNITALAAHPGYTSSNITSGANPEGSAIKNFMVKIGNALFAMSARGGAKPTLYAATHPQIQGGEFIGPLGPLQFWGRPGQVQPRDTAKDPQAARRLWEISEELTGVSYLSA